MTRLISSLSEIAASYEVLFCDLWGCLHNGVAAFPDAVAALRGFRAGGGKVVLLTNAPRPGKRVIGGFDRLGIPRDCWDTLVSSGDAAQDAMFAGAVGRRVWHLGPEKDGGFFSDVPPEWAGAAPIEKVSLEEAEGIVCTGPFDELTETPEDYRARFLLARTRGLKMLCANPDLVVDMGERRIYCAGALAQLYEQMGGTALYFGKPHPPIYDLARRRLAAADGRENLSVLCIGDGINTDILGAAGEGLDALFITGGLHTEEFGTDPAQPEEARLQSWLGQMGRAPRWSIPFLA